MNKCILHKILLAYCLCLVVFSSCTENNDNFSKISSNENQLEIRLIMESNGTDEFVNTSVDPVSRLNVFVYKQDGTLFEQLEPSPTPEDGIFIAKLGQNVSMDMLKELYIVANGSNAMIEKLRLLNASEMKAFIIASPQVYNSSSKLFESNHVMSAFVNDQDYTKDRVVNVKMNRIYSKVSLKFVYDYSNNDTITTDSTNVEPLKVKVALDSIKNCPTKIELYPDTLNAYTTPDLQEFSFKSEPLVLKIAGQDITEMNSSETGTIMYDLFSKAPNLKLYPFNVAGKKTTLILNLDFYENGGVQPVVSFKRPIVLNIDKPNRNYLVTIYVNQMDKDKEPKTRIVLQQDMISCDYKVTEIP